MQKKSRLNVGEFADFKTENHRLKGWLNSVKEWLIGTSVKISIKSPSQNLPGIVTVDAMQKCENRSQYVLW